MQIALRYVLSQPCWLEKLIGGPGSDVPHVVFQGSNKEEKRVDVSPLSSIPSTLTRYAKPADGQVEPRTDGRGPQGVACYWYESNPALLEAPDCFHLTG